MAVCVVLVCVVALLTCAFLFLFPACLAPPRCTCCCRRCRRTEPNWSEYIEPASVTVSTVDCCSVFCSLRLRDKSENIVDNSIVRYEENIYIFNKKLSMIYLEARFVVESSKQVTLRVLVLC